MSRTYRRKKFIEQDKKWILRDWVSGGLRFNGWPFTIAIEIEEHSKEGQKEIAKYRSDGYISMEQVPKWYKTHFCRRPHRRKCAQALTRAVKYIDEDIAFPVIKKDALCYW